MRSPSFAARAPAALLLLLSCAASIVGACSGSEASPAQAKGPEKGELKRREPTRVRAASIDQREMVRLIQTTTVVESEKEIQIYPRASGVVTEIHVEEGDVVQTGQVLAVLDQREAKAMIDQSRVALAEARDAIERSAIALREAEARIEQTRIACDQATRDYDRNQKAALISEQALDALRTARDSRANELLTAKLVHERGQVEAKAAQTSLKKAELALERAELELSYTRIEAPFSGIIASRGVRVGGTVGRGTSVIETAGAAFVLTSHEELRAIFHRPQRELAWFTRAHAAQALRAADGEATLTGGVHSGIEIRAFAEAIPEAPFRGTIQRISPSIDPQSGSFRVTVHLENAHVAAGEESSLLRPGMLVRLEIVTDRHPGALVVPKRALRREGEVGLIFVVRDARARRIEVDEGFSEDEFVEVTPRGAATLKAGELVVVVGNRELEDGGEVELEAASDPTVKPATPEHPPQAEESAEPRESSAEKKS